MLAQRHPLDGHVDFSRTRDTPAIEIIRRQSPSSGIIAPFPSSRYPRSRKRIEFHNDNCRFLLLTRFLSLERSLHFTCIARKRERNSFMQQLLHLFSAFTLTVMDLQKLNCIQFCRHSRFPPATIKQNCIFEISVHVRVPRTNANTCRPFIPVECDNQYQVIFPFRFCQWSVKLKFAVSISPCAQWPIYSGFAHSKFRHFSSVFCNIRLTLFDSFGRN